MKTLGTFLSAIVAMTLCSAFIELATGLPLMFALVAAVSAFSLSFAAIVVVGAIIAPIREPLSLHRVGARATARPITRPVRVAA